MTEREMNAAILAELKRIAGEVFANDIEIEPGTYTAAELDGKKDSAGRPICVKYIKDEAKTVQMGTFRCDFPADRVFHLVWKFERLLNVKAADKARFTKAEERGELICSFAVHITKKHLELVKTAGKNEYCETLNYINIDPLQGVLFSSNGKVIKEYPATIEADAPIPTDVPLCIDPRRMKEMVGRCTVRAYRVYRHGELYTLTEVTNDRGETFLGKASGRAIKRTGTYPGLSPAGHLKMQEGELPAFAGFVKGIAKRDKKGLFSIRTAAGESSVCLSYDGKGGQKEIRVALERPALADMLIGFCASAVMPTLPNWTGGMWITSPYKAVMFDDKEARICAVMPAEMDGAFVSDLERCDINPIERKEASGLEKGDAKEEATQAPGKHLPALYEGAQTGSMAFVFALLGLIQSVADWFFRDQMEKTLQRLQMLSELSGIPVPEPLETQLRAEAEADTPEPEPIAPGASESGTPVPCRKPHAPFPMLRPWKGRPAVPSAPSVPLATVSGSLFRRAAHRIRDGPPSRMYRPMTSSNFPLTPFKNKRKWTHSKNHS